MTRIFPNFLPAAHYRVIRDLFLSERLPWHYNCEVVSNHRQFMFTHGFIDDGRVINPHFFEPVRAMLDLIQPLQPFIGVSRIKANLYTNQGRIIKHPVHRDIPTEAGLDDKVCIGVYHVNACNGMTVIDGERVPSRDNQLVLFGNLPHYGTTQTDTDTRVMINFNLRTRE